jgi:hypothetical protein
MQFAFESPAVTVPLDAVLATGVVGLLVGLGLGLLDGDGPLEGDGLLDGDGDGDGLLEGEGLLEGDGDGEGLLLGQELLPGDGAPLGDGLLPVVPPSGADAGGPSPSISLLILALAASVHGPFPGASQAGFLVISSQSGSPCERARK